MLSTKRGRRGVIPPRQHAQTRINLHQNKYSPLFKTTAPPFFYGAGKLLQLFDYSVFKCCKKKEREWEKKEARICENGNLIQPRRRFHPKWWWSCSLFSL